MGTDEHGPAYPEPRKEYRCPICNGDKNRFFTCEYPGCPDGRDRGHPYARLIETYDGPAPSSPTANTARSLVGWACFLALALWVLWPHSAPAMDHGFNPNSATTKWFERLQRPNMPGSCCGKGDAYPVEDYWRNADGTWTAKIGDGSAKAYPDGMTRQAIPNGTEVPVPPELVNKLDDDLDNPTDVSWVFMTVHGGEVGTVYCLIRHPQGG